MAKFLNACSLLQVFILRAINIRSEHTASSLIAARALATYLIAGALGEGSGWDLRVRPSASAAAAASGNLGTWKSRNLEIWGPGNPEIWYPKNHNSQNSNPFCPKCRQGLD